MTPISGRPSLPTAASVALIATAAVIAPAVVVTHPPSLPVPVARRVGAIQAVQRVVPPVELPAVEPVKLVDLSPDEARAFNAEVPFSTDPNPAARAFRFAGSTDDRARAQDCLAAAVLYEAGDDAPGERAVAQVVLNRLRHPAFPKSVCAVVFEGAERSTGCQFTFTCDGALTRWTPSAAGWRRARDIAAAALSGGVYAPVGYATHYHTDWVVPYWQSSLDKIAAVRTHLFFRWSGWWGTPPAFNRHPSAAEPVIAALAPLSDAHRTAQADADAAAALEESAALAAPPATPTTQSDANADSFAVTLDARLRPDAFRFVALKTCGERPRCKLLGWVSAQATPASVEAITPDQMMLMSFSYLRDRAAGFERMLWNCRQFPRPDPRECMKPRVALSSAAPAEPTTPPKPAQSGAPPTAPLAPLPGVRRRSAEPVPDRPSKPSSKLD
ncbi:Cell Wall Hydrolase [Sphingomonas gellani]|uniref:Cell Wall Hydrolase n=1 Tax=Sphingomonas gellani TaxID=1166340 RepID=A0A1H8EXC1_9SPHN|nr:cell wall hydrolase [Sphingomonas gellani]SEN24109.1 Cell Wall Hydrolase [Sphingomonas gellani]